MENLTVDKAIQKGHQWVNYPVAAILIIGIAFSVLLVGILKSGFGFLIGFAATFALAWLWWSFMITKWRIWAFENCRNVHELRRRAVNEKLIWPEGSIFEKTEIRNFEQKKKLKSLNKKFQMKDEPEIIFDDGSVPYETKIYYSKISKAILWVFGIGLCGSGLYLATDGNLFGYIVILISIFFLYDAYKKTSIREAYVTLNSKGIQTLNTAFIEWKYIEFIEIKRRGYGKHSKWYLLVDFKKNDGHGNWGDELEINDLSVSPKKMGKLIRLYQQRNRNTEHS